MMTVGVEYSMPVIAYVDLVTGEIVHVFSGIEGMSIVGPTCTYRDDCVCDTATPAEIAKAIEYAETSEWPVW